MESRRLGAPPEQGQIYQGPVQLLPLVVEVVLRAEVPKMSLQERL